MNELLKKLSNNEVFAVLTTAELQALLPIIDRIHYKAGDPLFRLDNEPQHLYLVESGSFYLHLYNNEVKRLYAGELMGEIGVVNGDFRSGKVSAAEDSTVISICGKRIFDPAHVAPEIALKLLRALSKKITNYLRSREQITTAELIQAGESDAVEFKSTLRWNLNTQKKDRSIENACLKTIVAFLNTKGGMLLIGVADDGTILGLENDQFKNNDKLLLHLSNIAKKRIGPLFLKYLFFSIEKIDGKNILRVDCSPATRPAYLLDTEKDHFYIRSGPLTTDLRLSKVYSYIKDRFEQ